MVDTTTLGKKLRCPNCGIKFYDMNKIPVKCPQCGIFIEDEEQNSYSDEEYIFSEESDQGIIEEDTLLDVDGLKETLVSEPLEPKAADEDLG